MTANAASSYSQEASDGDVKSFAKILVSGTSSGQGMSFVGHRKKNKTH